MIHSRYNSRKKKQHELDVLRFFKSTKSTLLKITPQFIFLFFDPRMKFTNLILWNSAALIRTFWRSAALLRFFEIVQHSNFLQLLRGILNPVFIRGRIAWTWMRNARHFHAGHFVVLQRLLSTSLGEFPDSDHSVHLQQSDDVAQGLVADGVELLNCAFVLKCKRIYLLLLNTTINYTCLARRPNKPEIKS